MAKVAHPLSCFLPLFAHEGLPAPNGDFPEHSCNSTGEAKGVMFYFLDCVGTESRSYLIKPIEVCEAGSVIIPISEMWKPRCRKGKSAVQGHIA